MTLNNRLQALQDEETTMKDNWKGIQEAPTTMCQEVLGYKKHHHEEWISVETLNRIEERKKKKTVVDNSRTRMEQVNTQAEYTEAIKQVKRSVRFDKQKYVEDLAMIAERVA